MYDRGPRAHSPPQPRADENFSWIFGVLYNRTKKKKYVLTVVAFCLLGQLCLVDIVLPFRHCRCNQIRRGSKLYSAFHVIPFGRDETLTLRIHDRFFFFNGTRGASHSVRHRSRSSLTKMAAPANNRKQFPWCGAGSSRTASVQASCITTRDVTRPTNRYGVFTGKKNTTKQNGSSKPPTQNSIFRRYE